MLWKSVITNNATDALYLSGSTYTMIPFFTFTGQYLNFNNAIIAAKYSLVTKSYEWIKAYN